MNKKNVEMIAIERIEILINNALREINDNEKLSQSYANMALKIAMRVRIRMPYSIRQLFCRNCKEFIVPGVNSRVRIGRTRVKCIRITCTKCNHVYRKLISMKKFQKSTVIESKNLRYYFTLPLYYLQELKIPLISCLR